MLHNTAHCILHTVHCTLETAHGTLHTTHCTALYTAHCVSVRVYEEEGTFRGKYEGDSHPDMTVSRDKGKLANVIQVFLDN